MFGILVVKKEHWIRKVIKPLKLIRLTFEEQARIGTDTSSYVKIHLIWFGRIVE